MVFSLLVLGGTAVPSPLLPLSLWVVLHWVVPLSFPFCGVVLLSPLEWCCSPSFGWRSLPASLVLPLSLFSLDMMLNWNSVTEVNYRVARQHPLTPPKLGMGLFGAFWQLWVPI